MASIVVFVSVSQVGFFNDKRRLKKATIGPDLLSSLLGL